MSKIYSIQYTPAGLDYVRRLLGTRPFDEAAPLIMELEQQRQQQDAAPASIDPQPAIPPAAMNGNGAVVHQELTP